MFIKNAELNKSHNHNIKYECGDCFFYKNKKNNKLIEGFVIDKIFIAGEIHIYKASVTDEDGYFKVVKIDSKRMIPNLEYLRRKKIKSLGII
jgi:hypothetical protein